MTTWYGNPDILAFEINAWLIIGWVLFGCVGIVAVAYGKMKETWQPIALGGALMVYPYFIPSGLMFWLVGIGLTVALPFARD